MNRVAAKSVAGALRHGRNFNRYISTASVVATRSLDTADHLNRHNATAFGSFYSRRMMSTVTPPLPAPAEKEHKESSDAKKDVVVSNYWGIARPKVTREDGSEWPWNCFMPWETYEADLSINLSKHHVPKTWMDKVAYRTVKLLRVPTDIFFQRRYGCRAMMLETVAAVPGMVGGMLLHLRSLRKFQQSGGWIKALLEEAENERMHLMTMVELVKLAWYERLLVLTVQGDFFNAFFDSDSGKIENIPALAAIAIDYWRLLKDVKLKDVITVIRADEAHHRDVNHFASDIHCQGKELRETPAPIGGVEEWEGEVGVGQGEWLAGKFMRQF